MFWQIERNFGMSFWFSFLTDKLSAKQSESCLSKLQKAQNLALPARVVFQSFLRLTESYNVLVESISETHFF